MTAVSEQLEPLEEIPVPFAAETQPIVLQWTAGHAPPAAGLVGEETQTTSAG